MKKIIPVLFACILIVAACGESFDGKTGSGETADGKSGKITVTPANACVEKNTQQQFESSADGATWSLEAVLSDTPAIGTITQDGLFTAGDKPALGKVIVSKGGMEGFAYVTIVPSKALCSVEGVKFEEKKEEVGDEETSDGTTDESVSTSQSSQQDFGTVISGAKWLANFDATLKYQVKGDEVYGYVFHKMKGGFHFTVDYSTGKVEMEKPDGFINVTTSNDVAGCETVTVNDPFLWITGTDAKLVDTNLVFGQKYLSVDHPEGVRTSCIKASFSDPNASVVDLIGKYAFPIEVDFQDGSSMPIHGSFSFSGREASIDGTVTLKKVDYQAK
jgi:hypothetical protein